MRHLLLPLARYTEPTPGDAIALAGRTRATATLTVGMIATPVTVILEASATGEDGTWDALVTFAVAVTGVTTKATTATPADFTLEPWHRYVRGRLAVCDAPTVLSLELAARFFEPDAVDAHKAMLSKEARTYSDLARLAELAEADVLELVTTRQPVQTIAFPRLVPELVPSSEPVYVADAAPVLDIALALPGVADAIVAECVKQTEHRWHRLQLAQRPEPSALVTLRQLGELAPGLGSRLDVFRSTSSTVWRGR